MTTFDNIKLRFPNQGFLTEFVSLAKSLKLFLGKKCYILCQLDMCPVQRFWLRIS